MLAIIRRVQCNNKQYTACDKKKLYRITESFNSNTLDDALEDDDILKVDNGKKLVNAI